MTAYSSESTPEAGPISLDEACDRTLERWGKTSEEIVNDCKYGHLDCSYRSGGPCMNEANSEEFARAEKEVSHGTQAGGTQPPAERQKPESMELSR